MAVALAAALILRAALRPVARMTADAAVWSDSDLDARFDEGPPHDEITRLAATLDTEARLVLERARAELERGPLVDGIRVRISAGICELARAGDAETLMRLAAEFLSTPLTEPKPAKSGGAH